jgi:hypothetical protein
MLLAGCSAQGAGNGLAFRPPVIPQLAAHDDRPLSPPALIATNVMTGGLLSWPTNERRRRHEPIHFAKGLDAYSYAIAANADMLVIPIYYGPGRVLMYNLKTKRSATLKDDYGIPYDVTIDTKGNIYALNQRSVTVYAAGSYSEKELSCDYPQLLDETIGVDNEGDVFVNASLSGSNIGVVEYPAGTRKCKILNLPEQGYPGGIGVDPKTDDLIVIDNPDVCAGYMSASGEGRMRIYPRPYRPTKFTQVDLNPQYCAGVFRLDKDSKHIYVADQSDEYASIIDARTYPAGEGHGFFSRPQFGPYAEIGGFTTIPNGLPN